MLFTFPSRYWFTIGYRGVFSLRRWFSRIPTKFHLIRGTWGRFPKSYIVSFTGLSPPMVNLSRLFNSQYNFWLFEISVIISKSASQHCRHNGYRLEHVGQFRLFPFRSPLLRKSLLFSLPPGTEMFQFPGFSSVSYVFRYGCLGITLDWLPNSEIHGS